MLRTFVSAHAALPAAVGSGRLMSSVSSGHMFKKILIANRGEIACRVMRTAKRLGIRTVAVYSDADAGSMHTQMADEAFRIGPAAVNQSYLLADRIVEAARRSGAEAIHPGYGFLSENANFADACDKAGVTFIGPPASAIRDMGSKSASKIIMTNAKVPVTPGYHGEDQSLDRLQAEAARVGYPVMLKAVMGGGGKGMRIVFNPQDLPQALESCQREAKNSFGDSRVLIERYLQKPRHVEFQVFCDKLGNGVYLFERDCSVQRRHQKVLEEAPAPGMTTELRSRMGDAAVAAAKAVGYVGAGTVEFMLDQDGSFYFMEMNTRLQVEHPVTEMITGQDLVEWQLRVAAGHKLPLAQNELSINGHAVEARVYAEHPARNFLPQTGKLTVLQPPTHLEHVRVDTGVRQGDEVTVFYDPMISKLICWGKDRTAALRRMEVALSQYRVAGLNTNIDFLRRCVQHPEFVKGGVDTSFLSKHLSEVLPEITTVPNVSRAIIAALRATHTQRTGATAARDPTSPWASGLASRPSTSAPVVLAFQDGEERFEATLTRSGDNQFQVQIGNETFQVSVPTFNPADNRASVVVDGRRMGCTFVVSGADFLYFPDVSPDTQYKLSEAADDFAGSAAGGSKPAVITPMPGKVVKVSVTPGQKVAEGDALMILEAMKMEHVIRAPCNGVVDKVFFKVDDFVQDGQKLVTFAEDEQQPKKK